jgi:hypothetical protein
MADTAYRTLEIATALNLEPCFKPVESPESNGWLKTFVKTFKRDYVRVNPISDAGTARIDQWREDCNSEHPPPVWATAHQGSTLLHFNRSRVRSNGVNST